MAKDRQSFLRLSQDFPHSAGVYIMRDRDGEPLYIGKALDLKTRVRSYFLDTHADRPHIPFMLRHLDSIEWIATSNDTEALILEANLIRKHEPRFNVELKDDKHYPYLKITLGEPFPRLLVVRRVEKDGAKYLGPYTDVRPMRRMAAFARRVFRIRDCNKKLPLSRHVRPCINFSMGQCSAACAGKISQGEYQQNVDMLIKFLLGRRKDIVAILTNKMTGASEELEFEKAALYRDQIQLVKDAAPLQRVDLRLPDTDCDVVGIHSERERMCLSVLCFREGLLMSARHFLIRKETWDYSESNHDNVILQYYLDSSSELPWELLIPDQHGFDTGILQDWFLRQCERKVTVSAPQRGIKAQLVEMATRNARLFLAQNVRADSSQEVTELQKALNLPRLPSVIEAFDISNLGPDYTVAGMVQFREGKPAKSQYRKYKIKTVEGQNDFAMMMEVVGRRLTRLRDEDRPFPDLLLIDGGKGQLHAALRPLDEFSEPPAVASLAKKEELLFSPFVEGPVRLSPSHPARRLAERIRDEVHRFTVTYHRTIRGKTVKRSTLESIPGIGKQKARRLLNHFGSVRSITSASVEDIAGLQGFTESLAREIKQHLAGVEKALGGHG